MPYHKQLQATEKEKRLRDKIRSKAVGWSNFSQRAEGENSSLLCPAACILRESAVSMNIDVSSGPLGDYCGT